MKLRIHTYRAKRRLRLTLIIIATAIGCIRATGTSESQQIDSLISLGLRHTASTSYAAALECNLQALDLAKRTKQTRKLPSLYLHIGNIFSRINDLETARTYYLRAFHEARKNNDDKIQASLLTNLFYVSFLQKKADSAAYYLDRLEQLGPTTPHSRHDLTFIRGLFHELRDRPDSAFVYYHRAASLSHTDIKSRLDEAAAYSAIADLYLNLQMPDSAIKYYRINENIAREHGHMDLLVESLYQMAGVYDLMGEREKALGCKEEYLSLSDSILSREEISKIKNAQSSYEMEGNANTIRSLNIANTLQRNWILTLAVFGLVMMAFSAVVWIQKRRLSRAYANLFQHTKDELNAESRYRERIAELESRFKDLEAKTAVEEQKESENERRLLQNKDQRSRLMERIRQEFENSDAYCRSDYSIDILANAVGSNARYVSEAINEEYGANFRALINELRIKRSMQMLSDEEKYGHLTIKAISEQVGYRSHSTFISIFVRQTGLKPSLYMALSRAHKEKS